MSSSTSTSGFAAASRSSSVADGAMRAVALVLERRRRVTGERGRATGGPARARHARPSSERGRAPAVPGPRTYSSSASTKTQNGRSRSSSDAEPAEDEVIPCLGALDELREQSSLADPGLAHERRAPPSRRGRARPRRLRSSRARRRVPRGARRRPSTRLRRTIDQPRRKDESAQRSGCSPRCRARRRGANLAVMSRYVLHHRHEAAGVRRRLRLVQGA